MSGNKALLRQALKLLERLEDRLPPAPPPPDWDCAAQRWRREGRRGWLQGVRRPHGIRLDDLKCMDRQKAEIDRNTRQFVQGRPANNVLLWGSRGTGKSSLIKALLNEYCDQGLRLIEVEKEHLVDLPDIVEHLEDRAERFLLYCDDLSFEANDASYKSLKAILDGSVAAAPDNVLIYATSNRRHLLPEFQRENLETRMVDEEIHHGEGVEEKISLSERFGLWLSFYPFRQEQYLEIVEHWLGRIGAHPPNPDAMRQEALRWALARGSRSGRVAWQFARDWAGSHG
jgi:predicted AAA+ superfamily ATPase